MAAWNDLIGLLTTPVAVRGPASRQDQTRYEPGLDTGDPFQALSTAAEPTSSTFQDAAENLYMPHYVAYACVGAYADAIASLPIKLYEQEGRDRDEIAEHDILDLLGQPNPQQDGYEFQHALITSFLVGGEAPVEKVRNLSGTRVVQLQLMRPDRFGPIVDAKQGLVGYQYVVGTQGYGYDPDEIMFWKLSNPTNEWRGLSPLTAARLSIDTDLASGRYNKTFMGNSAIPGGVLETDMDLLSRERKEIRGEWESVHRTVNRAGRVAVLDKGLKFNGTSLSMRDAQWLEGREFDRQAICVVYRISPSIIGIEGTANRSEAEALVRSWYKGPVRSLARRIEQKLTRQLAREWGRNLVLEFYMDDVLRPDLQQRAEAGSKMWWIKPNEKRSWENLPPVEGGEELWIPVNMSQGGEPIEEVAPPALPPGNGKVPPQLLPPDGMPPEEALEKGLVRPFGR